MDGIFCKIINREIPSTIEYEDDRVIAFRDIQPAAKIHVLVVPKKHICCFDALTEEDTALLGHVAKVIQTVAEKLGIKGNYRVVNNCGESVGQSVKHLHFHILSNGDQPLPVTMC